MKRYFWNLLVWVTQTINVFTGGDPDETLSSRSGKARARGSKIGSVLANSIDYLFLKLAGQPNHCSDAIESDEGKDETVRI